MKNRNTITEKRNTTIYPQKRNVFLNLSLFLVLFSSLTLFIIVLLNKDSLNFLNKLIATLILIFFVITYILAIISHKKTMTIFNCFILLIYNLFNIGIILNYIKIPSQNIEDFTNKKLTYVVNWASKNNINLTEDYEYSDMIPEYYIIGQNIKAGTITKKKQNLTIAVSMGANPNKDVIIPDMLTWNSDKVLNFIAKNKLTNVNVDFIKSDKIANTVIEQNKSGSIKRNDELKLTFSLGEEDLPATKLLSLINKSSFLAEFYLKQHQINYTIKKDFSNIYKKDYVMKQSLKPGTMIKPNSDNLVITISRGHKITVPDFKKMTLTEITDWIIKNKLKLEFIKVYDEKIKNNNIIKANYQKGDSIEEGTLISITVSKGQLSMPNFTSLEDFYNWCSDNKINYSEKHEFSDSIEAGKVISYSYKTGETIKNSDTITVTISDGKKCHIPSVNGLSKDKALSKIKSANLNYTIIYQSSNSISKDNVIRLSPASDTEVSCNTTITVVLSSGKATSSSKSSSSNTNTNNNDSKNSTTCETKQIFLTTGNNGKETRDMIAKDYGNFKWNFNMVDSCPNGSTASGSVCNGSEIDTQFLNTCTTYTVTIVN